MKPTTIIQETTSRKAAPLLLANVVARLCGRRHRKDNQTVLSTVASSFPNDRNLGKRPRRLVRRSIRSTDSGNYWHAKEDRRQ